MKKFRLFLCLVCVLVVGLTFGACGTPQKDTNEQPGPLQTTITLAEAKEIIVNALAIESLQMHTMAATDGQGNRDLLEKMGKFTLDEVRTDVDVDTQKTFYKSRSNGIYQYHNYTFENFYSNDLSADYEYNPGEYEFEYYATDGQGYKKQNNRVAKINENIFEAYCTDRFAMVKALFYDEAFSSVYGNEAIKVSHDNGYSLTLQGDFKGFQFYWYILSGMDPDNFDSLWLPYEKECQERYTQEVIDACHLKVTINFDNQDNIIGAVADAVALSPGDYNVQTSYLFTFTKTDAEIEQPQWLTDYWAQQGQAA
ncbi:MAG: hypothetical protein NC133_02060 [Prevotella sp.]|nr:hypothetical protein [Prevotella sp.]